MHDERITMLNEHLVPIDMQDAMAEAGRKALLVEFIRMLSHEAGSRTGEDIEDVHQMRVATRRMRSAWRVFGVYYKPKAARSFKSPLSKTADALGVVRDLDVLIEDLLRYQSSLDEEGQAAMEGVITRLDKRRAKGRGKLITWLDGEPYSRFLQDYGKFLTKPGKGTIAVKTSDVVPHQVRHVVPFMLHKRLANVRAFDTVLDGAEAETLHSLRITFKQLRYNVAFFQNILGTSVAGFIEELKSMQDYLGRLNDIAAARVWLGKLKKLSDAESEILAAYLAALDIEEAELVAQFPDVWTNFNKRTVQRKLSDSLLVLR